MFSKRNETIKKYNLYFHGVINMYWSQAMVKLETVLGVFWGYLLDYLGVSLLVGCVGYGLAWGTTNSKNNNNKSGS